MIVKVMGPGCANCQKLADLVAEVVKDGGLEVVVEKVTDFQEMAMAGVLSTPALVVDGEIKCVGKVPSREEIAKWLA